MTRNRWIVVTLGLLLAGVGSGAAQAQANLSNQQLAEQWVNCLQGRPSTAGDCSTVQSEFNRRANETRQRDLRVQRGETLSSPSTGTTPTRPAAESSSTTQPTARPAPSQAPRPTPSHRVASEDDPHCAGREVVLIPGGYLCR